MLLLMINVSLGAAMRSRGGCIAHHRHEPEPRQMMMIARTFLTYQSRNDAIKSLFQHLESNYGNLSSLIDEGSAAETIVADDGILHPHHLVRLFRHDATALHVPNFYRGECAKRLGGELMRESLKGGGGNNWKVSTSRGLESSDVATIGEHSPYNVAVARDRSNEGAAGSTSSAIDDYFDGVQREFRSRRTRGKEHYQLWPLDKLRLELEEAWPSGAGLARETNTTQQSSKQNGKQQSYPRPFGGGLPRIMRGPTRWKRGFIHVDELGPLDDARGLFSANIYLTTPGPENGGDDEEVESSRAKRADWNKDSGALYVWPLGVRSRWDWYRVSPNCLCFHICAWKSCYHT